MAKTFPSLDERLKSFIADQKLFFVASAANEGEVNVSPKGYDTLRIINNNRVAYLDYPGSGNETANNVIEDGRITIMFCSFDRTPMILRLYGKGEVIAKEDDDFAHYFTLFDEWESGVVRQIIAVDIDYAMTSCGYGVPLYEFQGEREELKRWSLKKFKNGTLYKYLGKMRRLLEN